MESTSDVVIVGGGLAGLTAAIHLAKFGVPVTVVEKHQYPRHKVCGEYVSNEILPYLDFLELDIESLHPVRISKASISTVSGYLQNVKLPLGGFGVSRYMLDDHLFQKASQHSNFVFETVSDIGFDSNEFSVVTPNRKHKAKVVIGAFGKRSIIDIKLDRSFIRKKSPWLAVKSHYKTDFPSDTVALHNFEGGYCGVSKVEDDIVNICYLAGYNAFKKFADIDAFQENVLMKNPHLKRIFDNSEQLIKPLTISQLSFADKHPIDNHVLMAGDAAGLIHPFCGNGMAMAIHSGKIAAEVTMKFLSGEISRNEMEHQYSAAWKKQFASRIKAGRVISKILLNHNLSNICMKALHVFPFVLPKIVRSTHGKVIAV